MDKENIIGNPQDISKQFRITNTGGKKIIKALKKEYKESLIRMLDAFDEQMMKEFESNVINNLNNASSKK